MEDGVATVKRSYDNERRREASQETRRRIVETAGRLLTAHGYRAMTVAAVAAGAGVHVDTVYALVGRKPMLVRELIEQAISGTDHAVAAEDRDDVRAVRAERDPERKLARYAHAVRVIAPRLAPLFVALRDAGADEPDAAALWAEISSRRAANMRLLAAELADSGRLRPHLTIEDAADTIWVTNSPDVYLLLTRERGWSDDRFEAWLARTWIDTLLVPAARPRRR
jgi:AcrR family transcriptional regulator